MPHGKATVGDGVQSKVFWVVILCSVAVGYQRFGRPCCIHHPEDGGSTVLLISYHNTICLNNPKDLDFNLHHCENLKSCIRDGVACYSTF